MTRKEYEVLQKLIESFEDTQEWLSYDWSDQHKNGQRYAYGQVTWELKAFLETVRVEE